MPASRVVLPHHFTPRPYQLPALAAHDRGIARQVLIWHRRAGKDKTCVNLCAKASQQRVGTYYYFLPTYAQGKKIIWDGMDKDGFKFLDHFPKAIRDGEPNGTEMKLKLRNGSIFQVVGSDNIDSIVGTNPVGAVFSEYALQDPRGWDYIRPIMRENGGWAMFPYTPRGKNHGWKLYRMALENPDWFVSHLTVADTGILTEEDIDAERRSGMDEELIQQEFYCSFDAGMSGAYYANALEAAERDGRITAVPYDPKLKVDTWWDIGIGDQTAIWFVQVHYSQIRVIDYHESAGKGLPYYLKLLQDKNYIYGEHIGPHDLSVTEYGTGRSRLETALELGLRFKTAPKLSIEDGIEATRMLLPILWFDKMRCERGLDALRSYHKEWDDKRAVWRNEPQHDWSCFHPDTIVWARDGTHSIMNLPENGEVMTPNGWRQYQGPRITRRNARVVEVRFSDGSAVKCTPDHLFLTDAGWISAENLGADTSIQSCSTPLRNLMFAKQLRIAGVIALDERVDVCCIHVPDIECFALANGAIVHNSHAADAMRSGAVGRKAARIPEHSDRYRRSYGRQRTLTWMAN